MSNDIGMHNYIDFIRMLIAVFITVVMQLVFCGFILGMVNELANVGFVSKDTVKSLNWVTLAVSILLLLLDTYLLTFHIYLISKNTSTYKHIRK